MCGIAEPSSSLCKSVCVCVCVNEYMDIFKSVWCSFNSINHRPRAFDLFLFVCVCVRIQNCVCLRACRRRRPSTGNQRCVAASVFAHDNGSCDSIASRTLSRLLAFVRCVRMCVCVFLGECIRMCMLQSVRIRIHYTNPHEQCTQFSFYAPRTFTHDGMKVIHKHTYSFIYILLSYPPFAFTHTGRVCGVRAGVLRDPQQYVLYSGGAPLPEQPP